MQSYREIIIYYPNDYLEPLFVGWFEEGDESKKEELFRIAEINLLLEIDKQMPFIRDVCQNYPSVAPEDLRVYVERYAHELAYNRKHRNPDEPLGDIDKKLRDYWNDEEKRREYDELDKQIKYVVKSIIREAITHNPRWTLPLFSFNSDMEFVDNKEHLSEEEMAILEIREDLLKKDIFSEDEKAYMCYILEYEGDSIPSDFQIENELGWYHSKVHRIKKSIADKITSYINEI